MGILVARTRDEFRAMMDSLADTLADAGVRCSVGFVPTMGALHEGHATLVRRSAKENAITAVSIFVNPKQFGANEDLSKYPRTLEADLELCEKAGAQVVFAPTVDQMYPDGFATQVAVSGMGEVLCGAYRPGHFVGVCTVVLLLLNLSRADKAYFGLKDFQQFAILQRMAHDIAHPTRLVGVPTVRDNQGLALSSRNKFLDREAQQIALRIPAALQAVAGQYLQGEHSRDKLLALASKFLLTDSSFELQYCEMRDAKTLQGCPEQIESEAVLAVAAFVTGGDGVKTRLIDNILLSRNPDHLEDLLDFVHRK
ncbi:MAG: hypothetical protein RI932_72 [Pseudomonadota bacterium]